MANRIKGITVEIGGDTTKLQTALKDVNLEIRNHLKQILTEKYKYIKLYCAYGAVILCLAA